MFETSILTQPLFLKTTVPNTDGIFNRLVTVFAIPARHVSWELSLGREAKAI
jgi:hypothetical protein